MSTPAEHTAAATTAVVVVNYGSHHLLRRHLVTLTDTAPEVLVVVVDNHVDDAERTAVTEMSRAHSWTTVLLDENLGFGAGVNRGVASLPAHVSRIVLLNPDASLDLPSLRALESHVDAHPGDLVAPLVQRPDGSTWSAGSDVVLASGEMRGWHKRPADAPDDSYQPWLSGACLALSRALWDRVGGFDDDYFLYWEDVDFSRRVLQSGGDLVVLREARAVHDEGSTHRGSTPARARSAIYYYYNARNRLLFASKHLSHDRQQAWLRTAPGAGYRLLLQGGRRQLRRPSRTVAPVWRGVRDGRAWLQDAQRRRVHR